MTEITVESVADGAKQIICRMVAGLTKAVVARDLAGALYYTDWHRPHCFVWPETYSKIYHYQRIPMFRAPEIEPIAWGLPVVMRSAKSSLFYKYGKGGYASRVIERYLSRFRITAVDKPSTALIRVLWGRLDQKHDLPDGGFFTMRERYRDTVLVNGRVVPMNRDRIAALQKGIEIINKIDRLAA